MLQEPVRQKKHGLQMPPSRIAMAGTQKRPADCSEIVFRDGAISDPWFHRAAFGATMPTMNTASDLSPTRVSASPSRAATPALIAALRQRFGEQFSTAQSVRDHHGHDDSPYAAAAPDGVLFAQTNEDVVDAVRACAEHGVPIIAYGAGSSIEGHVLAVRGGITIDLSRMNAVLAVHAEDMTVTVQAGVTRKQLNNHIKDSGLFFPIDPGADASLGGMAATRASGTNAVRYGTMRENVVGLTVVTADGRIVRTARRAKKSSAGYDLTRLFVGSEGTLGLITEVTVRLYPQPESVSAAVCSFADVAGAVNTVMQTMQSGVPVARAELLGQRARAGASRSRARTRQWRRRL